MVRVSARKRKREFIAGIAAVDGGARAPDYALPSLSSCKRMSEHEAKEGGKSFALTSPWVLPPIPRRQRSERRVSIENAISNQKKQDGGTFGFHIENSISNQKKLDGGTFGCHIENAISNQKKLDSGTFGCHFEELWRSFSEDKRTSFTYLDCLWFLLYRKERFKEKVLTWIKKKHIFSKKYVLVPIVCWSHWNLLIFCHFGDGLQAKTRTPCMLLLDSLEMGNPRRFEPDIRRQAPKRTLPPCYSILFIDFLTFLVFLRFVLDIYKAEGRPENEDLINQIPLLVPKVPQQTNSEDCGRFVLYFIKLFMEGAPEEFRIEDYPYFMNQNWFTPQGLDSFCKKIGATETETETETGRPKSSRRLNFGPR